MGIPEGMRLTIGMEESDGFIPSELSSQNFLQEEGDLMIRVKEPPAGPVSCAGSWYHYNNNNNVHLSCAHQHPERSRDTY